MSFFALYVYAYSWQPFFVSLCVDLLMTYRLPTTCTRIKMLNILILSSLALSFSNDIINNGNNISRGNCSAYSLSFALFTFYLFQSALILLDTDSATWNRDGCSFIPSHETQKV